MCSKDTFSLDGLSGEVNTMAIPLNGINEDPVVLPDVGCKWAMLSNWTVGTDNARTVKAGASAAAPNTGNAGVEMYWGYNGKLFAQLFTGNTTDLLLVNNLKQLCVKGNGTVYIAYGK